MLQSAAWIGMVVSYTQAESSLASAVEKTFDGQHPCNLCEVVKDGRDADREHDVQKRGVKLEGVLVEHRPILFPTLVISEFREFMPHAWVPLVSGVPTPPPRSA